MPATTRAAKPMTSVATVASDRPLRVDAVDSAASGCTRTCGAPTTACSSCLSETSRWYSSSLAASATYPGNGGALTSGGMTATGARSSSVKYLSKYISMESHNTTDVRRPWVTGTVTSMIFG